MKYEINNNHVKYRQILKFYSELLAMGSNMKLVYLKMSIITIVIWNGKLSQKLYIQISGHTREQRSFSAAISQNSSWRLHTLE